MSKKPCFRALVDRQQVTKHCCNLNSNTFTLFINNCEINCIEKILLVIHKILRLFVNTFGVNDKHFLLNRENLTLPIKMQLSQKQKTFSEFFFFWIFKIYVKF